MLLPFRAAALTAPLLLLAACAEVPTHQSPASQTTAADSEAVQSGRHPLNGRIWSAEEGRFVDAETAIAAAAGARFVLLGETHDNPDHHRLQARFIKEIALTGRRPAVVWEMIGADKGAAVAGYWGRPGHDADGLAGVLDWANSGWPDWSMYAPIAEAALAAKLPIAPGDMSQATRRAVIGGGINALGGGRAAALALDRPLSKPLSAALGEELKTSHCGMLDGAAVARLADVQRTRDAVIADALIRAADAVGDDDGAVLIAGGGHVREDRGVPWYLRARDAEGDVLTVRFVEVFPGYDAVSDYAASGEFDLLWFTTRVDRGDPCEVFRKRRSG